MMIRERLYTKLNRFLKRRFQVKLTRTYGDFETARDYLIATAKIDTVVDGGANSGQWALRLLSSWSAGLDVVSFEPTALAFAQLVSEAASNPRWDCRQFALGDVNGHMNMHLASNQLQSSSLKAPTGHLERYPSVTFSDREDVSVRRLDSFLDLYGKKIYLKLDIHGYEFEALLGSTQLSDEIQVIEVETSFLTMYDSDLTHYDIIPKIIEMGFNVYAFTPPGCDANGRCLYIDVLLVKKSILLN